MSMVFGKQIKRTQEKDGLYAHPFLVFFLEAIDKQFLRIYYLSLTNIIDSKFLFKSLREHFFVSFIYYMKRGKILDNIIRHIIDIDKRANSVMVKTQELIDESERDTKTSIERMKADIIGDAKIKADDMYLSIINEAKAEAHKIKLLSEEDCLSIESKFINIKETLENRIFYQMLNDNMGGINE